MALNLTGNRYVFLKSMQNSKNPTVAQAYKDAQAQLSEVKGLLSHMDSNYESETNTELFKIRNYIDFIKHMSTVEQSAAEEFFNQQIILLRQKKETDLANKLETYLTQSKEDPMKFIQGLNELMQGADIFEKNIKTGLERIRSISKDWENFDADTKNSLTNLFEQSYSAYRTKFMQELYKLDANQRDTKFYAFKNVNTSIASAVNKALKIITKDKQFLQQLYDQFNANGSITDGQFKTLIVNTVTESVLSQYADKISEPLVADIKDSLTKMIDDVNARQDMIDKDYDNLASTKKFQSLEQEALKKNSNLSQIILELDTKSIEDIKQKYPNTTELINNLLELARRKESGESYRGIKTASTNLNRILKKDIKDRINSELKDLKQGMTKAEMTKQLKNIKGFLTPLALSQKISVQLGHTGIDHDAIAEAITTREARAKILGVIESHTGASIIKLKADVNYYTEYVNSGGDTQYIDETEIQNIVNNTISTYFKDFMTNYNKKGSGATNVNAAIDAYKEQLYDMKNYIDKLVKDKNLPDESRKELYDALYKTFSASVSVKDYELYNNELGVHGGNLGPGKLAEGVINNIDKLYELGGITRIDAEKVLFAALNCGSAMIGSDIKQHIETYLLGGAALMMFDDAFANTEEFLKNIQQEFDGFKGQKTVHFYRVQNMYAPASYILNEIAANLEAMYADLEAGVDFSNVKLNNSVTITNNITEADMPKKGPWQERWDKLSEVAQNKVSISFNFMGGLLDVFENFGKAFEQT